MTPQRTRLYPSPLTDRGRIARLEAALDKVFLSSWPRSDPAVVQAVENEVFRRYNQAVRFSLPWVDRVAPLAGKEVVEIGCGSGSSTAAFAHLAGRVYAYDIVPHLIQATRARAEVLGLKNITCDLVPAQAPLDELRRRHAGGVDFVLLYALLEHCTSTECLETLRTGWELLRPGGHLVVIETPNRFTYLDYHTSFHPFFHLLPRPIALRYIDRIPRALVKEELARALEQSEEAASLSLTRLGIGIGYQEFQLGLGQDDLGKLLAADGFEPEMLEHFPPNLEERLLQTFFLEHRLDVPIGFSRVVLNLIFRKPAGALPEKPLIDPASRAHLLVNYARNTDEGTPRRKRLLAFVYLLTLAALGVFAFLAWEIQSDAAITQVDVQVADRLHEVKESLPRVTRGISWIMHLGSMQTLTAIAVIVSLFIMRVRHFKLLAAWLVILFGGEELNRLLKDVYHRPRPSFPGVPSGWSFPSGHSMASWIGYGMLIYVAYLLLPRRWGRVALAAGATILAVAFSRVYLGHHYLSDVVGGFAAAMVWLGVWIQGIELVRWARQRRPVEWSRTILRFGLPVIVVGLAGGALAVLWSWPMEELEQANRVSGTVAISVGTPLLLLIWLLAFSTYSWKTRLMVLGIAAAVIGAAAGSVRDIHFSGNMVPLPEFRWARTTDEVLEADRGRATSETPTTKAITTPLQLDTGRPEDFPEFRGRQRDGVVIGPALARDWTAYPPRLLWRRPVGGGYSSFAVAGNGAITLEQRRDQEAIVCYDAATGQERWSYSYPANFSEPLGGKGPRATPTIVGSEVYSLGATGMLVRLDGMTGRPKWSVNILEGKTNARWAMSGSPLVDNHMVVVNPGAQPAGKSGALAAYDRTNGRLIWASGDTPAGYSSPMRATLAGRAQILLFDGQQVAGYDEQDGKRLWKHDWQTQMGINVAQPLVLPDNRVFISSGYDVGCALLRIVGDPNGACRVEELWRKKTMRCKFSNPVFYESHLYGLDDGILTCLDAATGERKWKGGRYGHGQLLRTGDLLLVLAEDGRLVLVEASPSGHRELGRLQPLEGKTWNCPALVDGKAFVRNDHEMACYDLRPSTPAE